MKFEVGDIVTAKSDMYWLWHYEVKITGIKDDCIAYKVIKNVSDKLNQISNYRPYTFYIEDLKLIRKGNKNKRIS